MSTRIILSLAFLAIPLICLTACPDCCTTDTCDSIYHPDYRLADCQKTIGNFKKGNTTHYVHSEGFEFDLSVSYDSTFSSNWSDYCVIAEQENRTVYLSSTYPIMNVEINFYGRVNVSKEENTREFNIGQSAPVFISYRNTSFTFELDSTGLPEEMGIDNAIRMLDTITFNGVTYDSVFVIMDNTHYNAINYNEEVDGELAHLYFSRTKGILKLECTDGKSFTIKEGDDHE
ncbi:MAG: hypothetical protein IK012_04375 [Fibrobacter sp.]|uniref:hypothetical protein n=1 Tax=Fibrobacter sp. TaxID=35828 RepID=UPI0025C34A8C|nr:hypothetical protein [Fibrobacter sp.]MBR4784473.1 hypothetical protein [Fibrobacter sp.]